MARKFSEMSPTEQAQHRNWDSILQNPIATEEERQRARIELDALEWKGNSGPLMERITKLADRLDGIEEEGQAMTDDDRKSLLEMRELTGTISRETLDELRDAVGVCMKQLAEFSSMESQHHQDAQQGWSRHEADLKAAEERVQEINSRLNAVIERWNGKFRDLETQIIGVRQDLNAVITHAIDEARTAIMAEAESAALTAVSNLMGDGNDSDDDD